MLSVSPEISRFSDQSLWHICGGGSPHPDETSLAQTDEDAPKETLGPYPADVRFLPTMTSRSEGVFDPKQTFELVELAAPNGQLSD